MLTPPTRRLALATLAGVLAVPVVGGFAYEAWRRRKIAMLAPGAVDGPAPASPEAPAAGSADVILAGDSRIARWLPAMPAPDGVALVNRGIGGETTLGLLARLRPQALAGRPRGVVLQSGINDLVAISLLGDDARADAELHALVDRFARLVEACRAAGVPLLLTTIIPPGDPTLFYKVRGTGRLAALTATANDALARLPLPAGARLLDLRPAVCRVDPRRVDPAFQADALHLSAAGYAALNAWIAPALRSAFPAPSSSTSTTIPHP